MASIFRKLNYFLCISVGITSNTLLNVASLLGTGASPSLVNKKLIHCGQREPIKPIKSPLLQTANCEVVNVKDIVASFVRIGNLWVRPWFGIVETLASDVMLGTSFID